MKGDKRKTMWKEVWGDIKNYSSDGCTAVPDFTFRECCLQHDYYYRFHKHRHDGSPITRAEADKRLRRCISESTLGKWHYKLIPWLYWLGVRIGGRKAWRKES